MPEGRVLDLEVLLEEELRVGCVLRLDDTGRELEEFFRVVELDLELLELLRVVELDLPLLELLRVVELDLPLLELPRALDDRLAGRVADEERCVGLLEVLR